MMHILKPRLRLGFKNLHHLPRQFYLSCFASSDLQRVKTADKKTPHVVLGVKLLFQYGVEKIGFYSLRPRVSL